MPDHYTADIDVEVEADVAETPGAVRVNLQWRTADGLARELRFRMKPRQAHTLGLALLTTAKKLKRAEERKAAGG